MNFIISPFTHEEIEAQIWEVTSLENDEGGI